MANALSRLFRRGTEATPEQLVATGALGQYGVDPIDGDSGYTQVGANARGIPIWTLRKARAYSIAAYRTNPMARSIIDTYCAFIAGDSGVTFQCSSDIVREVVSEWWHDPRNKIGARQIDLVRDHMLMGETILEMLVSPTSGRVRMSMIDSNRVSGVELVDGNPFWPGWLHIDQSDDRLAIVQVDDTTGLRSGQVQFFTSWKTLVTDRRGEPFLMPILDSLDAFDQVQSNLIDRTALARYLVWDVTVKGDQKVVDDFIASRGGTHVPRSGSVEVHNEGVTWDAKTAQTGSFEDTNTLASLLTNIAGGAGLAKAQPLDAKVLSPTGWRLMGDLRVGDDVLTPKGVTAKVVGVYPQGEIETFEVVCSDGAKTRACGDHLWFTETSLDRRYHRDGSIKTTHDVAATLKRGQHWEHYLPLVDPIDGDDGLLPVDPYVLGVLLGDGHMRTKTDGATEILLSSADPSLIDEVNDLVDGAFTYTGSGVDYRYCTGREHAHRTGTLRQALSDLGLVGSKSHTKFIPDQYRTASAKARLSLLQGLLDTDGCASANTSASFSTVSPVLAEQVRDLVWSLGGVCTMTSGATSYPYKGEILAGRVAYKLRITLPDGDRYFRLARKEVQIGTVQKRGRAVRTIRSVESIGLVECQCIAIDDPAHLYVTDDYIVTHNTWLAEPAGANRATSLTMAEPVRRRVGGVQNMWLDHMTELARFVVDQAVAVGRIPAMVPSTEANGVMGTMVPAAQTVRVTGPEIAAADAQVTAAVLVNLSTSLAGFVAAGIMSVEAASLAAQKGWEQFVGSPFRADLALDPNAADDIASEIESASLRRIA